MTSLHWHGQRRELFAVRSGRMLLSCGDDRSILVEGELARSIPRVAHSLANAGSADLEVLELFSPYLLDDKVRVQDFYGRLTGSVTVDQ
jgi:mannose-6-phosphate isomerase-like protein (cupin superfamily)